MLTCGLLIPTAQIVLSPVKKAGSWPAHSCHLQAWWSNSTLKLPPPSLPVRFLRTGWSNTLLFVVWWENAASQKKRARRTMMKRSCGCHADAGSCDGRPGEKELGHGEMVGRQKTWWEQCGCPWLRSRPASSSHNHERNCRDSLWGVWGY